MQLDPFVDLLKVLAGIAGGQIATQWLVPRLRKAKDAAEVRKTEAETAKTEAETRATEFAFYRDQLALLKTAITELQGRLGAVETDLADLHAAVEAEPDDIRTRILSRSLARRRSRTAGVAEPEVVINSQTTTIGAVAGGNIHSIQEGTAS